MNARKHWVTLVVASIGVVLISSSAVAGSKQRHRWEGVAIGIGAAILGHAIYQSHTHHSTSPVVVVDPDRPCRRGPKHRHGHWEWRESWVPAVYERVWNPGHYKPDGRWIQGHWITLKTTEGHWARERVWVAGRHGDY